MKAFLFLVLLAFAVGCGGGGGSNSDLLSNNMLGKKTGAVTLSNNGCSSYREIPVTEIGFVHDISAEIIGENRLNITFDDNGYVCNALNVNRFAGGFDASCGNQPLSDFLPGYDCIQEIVWTYSEPTVDDPVATSDVIRTAYVRCSFDGVLQFACPVEYRGFASDCVRGLC